MSAVATEVPIAVRGDVEEKALAQLKRCAIESAVAGALCADHHLGYQMPIGGVIAYEHHVSISGVGYDIGCGNKAVLTNVRADEIDVGATMDEIVKRISFGMGRVNNEPVDHPVFDQIAHAPVKPQRKMIQIAKNQLGTVGSGNHYVDLLEDEDGWLWVGVHFGSRGFGHKTASGFLSLAAGKQWGEKADEGGMETPPILLDTRTPLGQEYIAAMQVAGDYAYAGRDMVVDKVLDILGAQALYQVHNHHNFAWREKHFGVECWTVRKGCTPAFPGQQGFVGATMGETSVILEGAPSMIETRASAEQESLLYSTVHGAGRVMSRTAAAGRSRKRWMCSNRDCDWTQPPKTHKPEDGKCPKCGNARLRKNWVQESEGKIDWPNVKTNLGALGIELRGGGADEAPGAYKRLDEVLAAHDDTIRILHRLKPLGVAMAGPDAGPPDD